MSTEKERVTAYLPTEVYEELCAFKTKQELSESKAISLIMSEYFQVGHKVNHGVRHQFVERKEFEELQGKVSQLSDALRGSRKPKSGSLSRTPKSKRSKSKSKAGSKASAILCPQCSSDQHIKNGTSQHGKQRYKCKDCGKQYS